MKTIYINFGQGPDQVRHKITASHPDELKHYLMDLKNNGWDLTQITSIIGGWTF